AVVILSLVSNGGANLSFEIGRDGIHLVHCASVVLDLTHDFGLIIATNFPVAIHADIAARVGLRHTSLLMGTAFELQLGDGHLSPISLRWRSPAVQPAAVAYVSFPVVRKTGSRPVHRLSMSQIRPSVPQKRPNTPARERAYFRRPSHLGGALCGAHCSCTRLWPARCSGHCVQSLS